MKIISLFRFYLVLYLLIFVNLLFAKQDIICIYALPKSGTHLIDNIFKQLPLAYQVRAFTSVNGDPIHINGKIVVNIRDPRDYFVSLRDFTNKVIEIGLKQGSAWPGFKPIDRYESWLNMNNDERLTALITLSPSIPYYEKNIINNFYCADLYLEYSHAIVTRFEDLIGDLGGGSNKIRKETLKKVLNFFEWECEDSLIDNALEKSFEESLTFNVGKIGRWKEEFSEEYIRLFKEKWNYYLMKWGYEQDLNWNIYTVQK